jgi:hypothetical protein
MPMIAITTKSSTRVKAEREDRRDINDRRMRKKEEDPAPAHTTRKKSQKKAIPAISVEAAKKRLTVAR